jgi:hypothetical protein
MKTKRLTYVKPNDADTTKGIPALRHRFNRQTPRNTHHATRNFAFLHFAFICLLLFAIPTAHATVTDEAAFRETIYHLSSLADRSTGTDGNRAAAAFLKAKFEELGFETVGIHEFSVPLMQDEKSILSIPGSTEALPIRSLRGNAVTPQTIAPPGISAPLIYVGRGDLRDLNGKAIEGSIILMEFDSGKNWLQVADLGARAQKSSSFHPFSFPASGWRPASSKTCFPALQPNQPVLWLKAFSWNQP